MSADASDRCPRCSGAFHCGANDPEPCPCATLKFDEATLAELRRRYAGCLCLSCLRELAPSTTAAVP